MFRKISLLFVSLLFLAACTSKDVTFSGQTDNWEAELMITQNSDTFENQDFVLEYKGDEVDSVGKIAYNVDSIGGGFGREGESLDENGSIRDGRESRASTGEIPEDAEVEVTVEWNGQTETFTLNRE
ncbi:hypothetical protein V1502_16200 [Bacillus sp. SCS-153A]|uniref:hypothetical protein n=1 Tax=Rossellomorea sedimentorum TaxID=3115294 RepID=UPI003905C4D2